LQRRMLRLEREIAALRRAGVPEPGQSHPAASAATGPFPEDEPEPPRPPAWADWLAATPEPVRQDLERLTRLIENLCQELAALRRRDLLPQSLRASPTASSLPLPVAPTTATTGRVLISVLLPVPSIGPHDARSPGMHRPC
jgi:hypothetical protein